ncbi:MAG: ABC transporter permease [candidate division Zixibacteria bacterium]|nr:ABC transporter permease [candidate division Zixibacteria bacterium]
MKGLLIFRLFLRDLKKQKKRITLTIMAIAWGTISIVLLLSFGEGMKRALNKAQHGLGEDIVIMWGGQTSIPYQGLGKGRRIRFIDEDVELLKKRVPQIESISGEYTRWGVSLTYKKNTVSERVTGAYPSFKDMRAHYAEIGGRFIDYLDMKNKRRVVFLGNELKERLFGKEEDAIGKTIILNKIPFTVIGVMIKKLQMGMYGGPDWDKATIPATTFKAIFGHKYLNNMVYKPEDASKAEEVKKEIQKVLGAKYKFDPKDDKALSLWDVIEGQKIFNKVLLGFHIFMGIIGGMTLLIAGVGVANIMYVAVKERTREIGIKMALGAKRFHIMSQFILESLLIAVLGGGLGIVASVIIVEIWGAIPVQADWMEWIGTPVISMEVAVITAVILGTIGILSGIFPSRKAASVNPVESLRYE